MTPVKLAYYAMILLLCSIVIGIVIKYANTPISELPTWAYFLIK